MQIVNNEVSISFDLMENRTPTHILRFRDIGSNRVLLEQRWESSSIEINPQWIPVPMCENQDKTNKEVTNYANLRIDTDADGNRKN